MFLAALIGPMYLIIGLSFLIQTKSWLQMAKNWTGDQLPIKLIMVFNILFGLAIIAKHNVWEWSPYAIVTITGWGAFLKGAANLLLPNVTTNTLIKGASSTIVLRLAGLLACLIGGWLSYLIYLA